MGGRVARLAEAVVDLERRLREAHERAVARSNDLVKLSDELGRELSAEISRLAESIVRSLWEDYRREEERIRREYSARAEEELRLVEETARSNLEKAVKAVLDEVKRMAGGV